MTGGSIGSSGSIGSYWGHNRNGDFHRSFALIVNLPNPDGSTPPLEATERVVRGTDGSEWTVDVYGDLSDREILSTIESNIRGAQESFRDHTRIHGCNCKAKRAKL